MAFVYQTLMNKLILIGAIAFAIAVVFVLAYYQLPSANACGKCWNVTKGEPLDVVAIDLTGHDAGYAIKMDCTVDEKPNPPGSPLHLTCTEKPIGNYSRTGVTVK